MLRLPYLCEAYQCLRNLEIDLCVAGNLRDPVSGQPIRKALTILTTSEMLVDQLHGLRCPRTHKHQVIEGTVKHEGVVINRSTFTEHYPRKFARKIALCFRKSIVHRERSIVPSMKIPWFDLPVLGADTVSEPATKRRRIASQARLKLSRVAEASALQNPKIQTASERPDPWTVKDPGNKSFPKCFPMFQE